MIFAFFCCFRTSFLFSNYFHNIAGKFSSMNSLTDTRNWCSCGSTLPSIDETCELQCEYRPSTAWTQLRTPQRKPRNFRRLSVVHWRSTQKIVQHAYIWHRIQSRLRHLRKVVPQSEEHNTHIPTAPMKGVKRVKGKSRKAIKREERIKRSQYIKPNSDDDSTFGLESLFDEGSKSSKPPGFLYRYQKEAQYYRVMGHHIPRFPCETGKDECKCISRPDDICTHFTAFCQQCFSNPKIEEHSCEDETDMCHGCSFSSNKKIQLQREEKTRKKMLGSVPSNFVEGVPEGLESPKPLKLESFSSSSESQAMNAIETLEQMNPPNLPENQKAEWDNFMNHIENVLIFAYSVIRADSWGDLFHALLVLIKMYYKGSIVMSIFRAIKASMSEIKEEEKVVPHSLGGDLRDGWTLFKTHKMWDKFTYLISAGMSLSVCSLKEIKFDPAGIKLVHIEASKKQECAFDVIDAVVETFAWMHDTGSQVYETGSLAPILYSDQRVAEFNSMCDWITYNAEKVINGNSKVPVEEFKGKIEEAIKLCGTMKKVKTDGAPGAWLQKKYEKLIEVDERVLAKMQNCAVREAPFGISLCGGTCVGKSTLGELTMQTGLTASLQKPYDATKTLTHDNFDEYQSTYTSDIEGLFLDDVANGKANFAKKSPTDFLIKVFNNVAAQAVKAELNAKGRVFINFKVGVLTTNVKHLDAHVYSNCPESILRRFYHVDVRVKKKFRKPGTTMLDTEHEEIRNSTEPIVDVWDLKIEEIWTRETNGSTKTEYGFRPVIIQLEDGTIQDCSHLDLPTYLQVLAALTRRHKLAQENVVMKSEKSAKNTNCLKCYMPPQFCKCIKQQSDEFGFFEATGITSMLAKMLYKSVAKGIKKYVLSFFNPLKFFGCAPVRSLTTHELSKAFQKDLHLHMTPCFHAIIPEWFKQSHMGQAMIDKYLFLAANYDWKSMYYMSGLGLLSGYAYAAKQFFSYRKVELFTSLGMSTFDHAYKTCPGFTVPDRAIDIVNMQFDKNYRHGTGKETWFPSLYTFSVVANENVYIYNRNWMITAAATTAIAGIAMMGFREMLAIRHQKYRDEFLQRSDALNTHLIELKKQYPSMATYVVAGMVASAALAALVAWNSSRIAEIKKQSIDTPEEVDKSPGWFGDFWSKIGLTVVTSDKVKTATPDEVKNAVSKNICRVKVKRPSGSGCGTNMVFLQKFVGLLPKHVLYEGSSIANERPKFVELEIKRGTSGPGDSFKAKIDGSTLVDIPELDMVMVYIANCPDIKTITHLLPLSKPEGNYPARLVVRNREAELLSDPLHVTSKQVSHSEASFYGGSYTTVLARDGACMGIVYSETKQPCITGFHIGGNEHSNVGVMQTLTKQTYDNSLSELSAKDAVLISSQAAEIPVEQYGRPLIVTPEVHEKAKHIRELPPEAYIEVLGSTKLRSEQRSQVVVSPLSNAVHEIMGVPNKWDAPKLKPNWKAYNTNIDYVVDPADQFVPSELERARQDWLRPLKPLAKKHGLKDIGRPLDTHETIMGVDGKRFLDAMPMKTSMGFPVFGPKSRFFTETTSSGKLERLPAPEVQQEADRLESCWRQGLRAYPVTTATLKDEPTKKTSEKVRVFQAGPVAFGLHLRRYFLPVLRFLQLHPIQSESAVGVNAFARDWEQLMTHVRKFSQDGKVLGLDYSKYDVRMNSQITIAVMNCFIDLAKEMGYSEEDLSFMRAMVADLVHPLIDFNGTMIMAFNMNTSGNNLTVNINSTAGALYLRLGFFSVYPEASDFRSAVAAMTYGDDMIGSVSDEYRDFNFLSYKEFLARYGIKITLPNKSDDEVDFLEQDSCDFLKRMSNYVPEIRCEIGKLDEDSIFKSLHTNLKSSSVSATEVAMSCCDTALHEWFAFGKEHYELRRKQLAEVCSKVGIALTPAFKPFEERVRDWKDKYESA